MRGKKSFNYSGIQSLLINEFTVSFAVSISLITGIMAGVYAIVGEDERLENLVSELNEHVVPYKLSNGSTVTLIEDVGGRNSSISYNFREEIVTIDGPDEADRVLQFSEFEKKQAIENARSAGCKASSFIPTLLEEFKGKVGEDYNDEYGDSKTIAKYSNHAESFSANFCQNLD